jgi:two-component system, response regulator
VKIVQGVLKKSALKNNVFVVRDGQEALDFIYHKGPYQDSEKYPQPDIILLDIDMPKLNGFEVLDKLKADPRFSFLPIVMLTSSENEDDVAKSYIKGAASYIRKPLEPNEFIEAIEEINAYWHIVDRMPGGRQSKQK